MPRWEPAPSLPRGHTPRGETRPHWSRPSHICVGGTTRRPAGLARAVVTRDRGVHVGPLCKARGKGRAGGRPERTRTCGGPPRMRGAPGAQARGGR